MHHSFLAHRCSFASESHQRKPRWTLSIRKGVCGVKAWDLTQVRYSHTRCSSELAALPVSLCSHQIWCSDKNTAFPIYIQWDLPSVQLRQWLMQPAPTCARELPKDESSSTFGRVHATLRLPITSRGSAQLHDSTSHSRSFDVNYVRPSPLPHNHSTTLSTQQLSWYWCRLTVDAHQIRWRHA